MTDLIQSMQNPIPLIDAEPPTLDHWYDIWLNTYKIGHIKPTTIDTYNALYEKHIRGTIGCIPISEFHSVHIQQIYNRFLENGYSARYLGTLHTLLSSLFKYAIANALIPDNPCSYTDRPGVEVLPRRVLSPDEQNRVHTYLRQPRFRIIEPLITTIMGTGLRIGEALGLRWEDIVISPDSVSYLNVRHTLVRVKNTQDAGSHFILQSPKTKCSIRSIPLQKCVVEALYRQECFQKNNQSNPSWEPYPDMENLVFSGKKGQPQWRSTVVSEIDTLIRTINRDETQLAKEENRSPVIMERVLPHVFRHTFATRCLEAGIPPKVVQHWLGHASIKMTLDLYTHVNQDLSSKHMQILEAAMDSEIYISTK